MNSLIKDHSELKNLPKGRRRYVTVLFADISGSSELAESLAPESYAELMEKFRALSRTIIPKHGGIVARLQGDGLLALFGHLETREDDGRRAVEAAIDLHLAISSVQVGHRHSTQSLQMHSGVHAGLLLLIEGDVERGRYDVVGEVPNTAARLCSMALSGEILISNETLGPQARHFDLKEMHRVAIRGRKEVLRISRIEGRGSTPRQQDSNPPNTNACIGRDDVLRELCETVEQAPAHKVTLALIRGEAGIGKTRVVNEFRQRIQGDSFQVFRGYCEGYLGAQPFQPFFHWVKAALGWRASASNLENRQVAHQALHLLAGDRAAEYESLVNAVYGTFDASDAKKTSKAVNVSELLNLLDIVSRSRRLVLILDDWQWVDDASRSALASLMERPFSIFILIATRPLDEDDQIIETRFTHDLRPLSPSESDRAIAVLAPRVNPFVAQEIYRLSGGSPLYIEELCHVAGDEGLSSLVDRAAAAWINSLVASRISRLPEAQANVLQVASVIGTLLQISMLQEILGDTLDSKIIAELAEKDFWQLDEAHDTIRFKHILTRDAAYATVDLGYRRALHLKVADALESAALARGAMLEVEEMSYHCDAAGDHERAWIYAEKAGDRALHSMALDRARAQYLVALRSLDEIEPLSNDLKLRWCGIAQKLAQACVFDPLDTTHGLERFERAARLAQEVGDSNALARAEYWLGYVNYGKGRPKAAVHHSRRALREAEAGDDLRLVAQIKATLGQALASAGRYDLSEPLMREAVESKRQQSRPGSGIAIGSAYTLARMAYSFGDKGRFDLAEEGFEEALHLLGEKTHIVKASIKELICAVALWQGRWDDAQALGLEGADIALQCRSRYLVAMGRALSACGAWARDQSEMALSTLTDSTDWIEERGGAVSTSLNYGWLVEATTHLGLNKKARGFAARLFVRARAEDTHGLAMGCRALAWHAAKSGQRERSEHYLRIADHTGRRRDSDRELALNHLMRARIAFAGGSPLEAKQFAQAAILPFEQMGMSWYLKIAQSFL